MDSVNKIRSTKSLFLNLQPIFGAVIAVQLEDSLIIYFTKYCKLEQSFFLSGKSPQPSYVIIDTFHKFKTFGKLIKNVKIIQKLTNLG